MRASRNVARIEGVSAMRWSRWLMAVLAMAAAACGTSHEQVQGTGGTAGGAQAGASGAQAGASGAHAGTGGALAGAGGSMAIAGSGGGQGGMGTIECKRQEPMHHRASAETCHGTQPFDLNACSTGNCQADSDCGDDGFCSPTLGSCGNYMGVVGYYCHTCEDECVNDWDCGRGAGCVYSQEVEHWVCLPFLFCGSA
jgi:hypothetical protein